MSNNASEIAIATEFITLGQFLKVADIISQGGEAKSYLRTHQVMINGESDNRRGRKLRPGDEVALAEGTYTVVQR